MYHTALITSKAAWLSDQMSVLSKAKEFLMHEFMQWSESSLRYAFMVVLPLTVFFFYLSTIPERWYRKMFRSQNLEKEYMRYRYLKMQDRIWKGMLRKLDEYQRESFDMDDDDELLDIPSPLEEVRRSILRLQVQDADECAKLHALLYPPDSVRMQNASS